MIAGAVAPSSKRWTLEEYRRLVGLGGFGDGQRTEFIEGEIIEKMGAGPVHNGMTAEIGAVLAQLFGAGFHVREEKAITVGGSEPEPDVAVIVGSRKDFLRRNPGVEDAVLVVEVSDTSLAFDQGRKAALYARGGVREYWIVDLNARRLLVYRGPLTDGAWEEVRALGESARVTPLGLSGDLPVGELFPPEESS